MTSSRTPEQEQHRAEGDAARPEDKLPTYQELLDTAVEDTFPASDPIAPNAARNTVQRVQTPMDARDWKLRPDHAGARASQEVVAEFDDERSARRARDEALSSNMPTARLDLPPEHAGDGPAATVTVVACDDAQRKRAEQIARQSGAAKVETHPERPQS